MDREAAISKAVRLAGGQSNLAKLLGLKPQSVQAWCATGEVPIKRAVPVEVALDGRVTRQELRPDVFGDSGGGDL